MLSKISAEPAFHCNHAAKTISTGKASSKITNNRSKEIKRMESSQQATKQKRRL
jgi:hypothetical protein